MADQIHPLQRFMKEADDLFSKVSQHRDTQAAKSLEYCLKYKTNCCSEVFSLSTHVAGPLYQEKKGYLALKSL